MKVDNKLQVEEHKSVYDIKTKNYKFEKKNTLNIE